MSEHYYNIVNGKKTYSAGNGKPPIFIQFILDDESMSENDFFHIVDQYLDWEKQGDDEKVVKPLVELLAKYGDKLIYAFDRRMTQLLQELDTKEIIEKGYKAADCFGDDAFLYSRCAALVNGKAYFNAVKKCKRKIDINLEFEALLYVPAEAWAIAHHKQAKEYSLPNN